MEAWFLRSIIVILSIYHRDVINNISHVVNTAVRVTTGKHHTRSVTSISALRWTTPLFFRTDAQSTRSRGRFICYNYSGEKLPRYTLWQAFNISVVLSFVRIGWTLWDHNIRIKKQRNVTRSVQMQKPKHVIKHAWPSMDIIPVLQCLV